METFGIVFVLLIIIAAVTGAFIGFVIPGWSIVDCAKSKELTRNRRVGWLIAIVLSWSIGAVAYGSLMTTDRWLRRLSRVAAVILLLVIPLKWLLPKAERKIEQQKKDIRVSMAETKLSSLNSALIMFRQKNGRYPTNEEGLAILFEKPATPFSELKDALDPWGRTYLYRVPGIHQTGSFDLYSQGPNGTGDGTDADDVTNWGG
jgi:general secretion pathway protein G